MRNLSYIAIILMWAVCVYPQSPHGKNLKMDCSYCHEPSNWKIIPEHIKFNHNTETPFKLEGQHTTVSCRSCHHSLIFSEVKSDCVSCHKDVHQNSVGTNCVKCHTSESWAVVDIIKIHRDGRFPLTGVHINVNCSSCHSGYAKLYFPPQSVSCFSCHKNQYYAATFPNHVQAKFSIECQSCHSINDLSWGTGKVDHSFFPLTGGHKIDNCFACHKSGTNNFKGLSTSCYPCHKQNYILAKNPDHIQAKFPTECQDCHNTVSFQQATFNHNSTGFALTGAHTNVACQSCHQSGYKNTPTDCYSCHSQDYAKTNSPNHTTLGFPHNCVQCHSTSAWSGATFDHSKTGFPLTGAHATVSCQSCHSAGYSNTPSDCYSCHSQDYAKTTDPNHAAQGFPHECTQCHSTSSWGDATFDHTKTGFPLTGAHAAATCQSCHASGYTNTSQECYSCHKTNYQAAKNPNHVAAGIPQTCQDCHNTTTFNTSTFNHSTTGFTLTGAHVSLDCSSCHKGTVTGLTTDCYSCHSNDYNSTTDPNHAAQGFSHDCTQCHSTTSWGDATFDHSKTGFPLTGAHTTTTCKSCHASGYTNTSQACYSCHKTNYQAALNPNHVAAGLPQTCQDCHNTTTFTTSTFNHSTTGFTLTGAHVSLDCSSCHKGTVTGLTIDCYSCHSNDYNSTTDPNHAAQGFSHDCTQCHSTTSWDGATFDHSNTGFPLTGAHSSVSCQSCHASGYNNTPTACYSCHASNFASTTNPPHQSAGYPTDCTECHTTTAWSPSTFNHTQYFPLTGDHNTACANCHQTISSFAVHSCNAVCHRSAHHQNEDCYSCHKTGHGD